MTEQTTNRAVVRAKTALQRQRRIALYLLIAVAVLGVALGLTLFFTSRTAFIDPTDGVKYYVAKKDGVYVLQTTSGDVLATTEGGNFVTAAGTIVYVNGETGDHSTVAAVLVEDGETAGSGDEADADTDEGDEAITEADPEEDSAVDEDTAE